MNKLSSTDAPALSSGAKRRVALLVDGENVSQDFAGRIIREAMAEGEIVIRRIYGDASRLPKWNVAPGFRMMHSGSGKNATDILLTVDAMALMLGAQADVLCIASSDRDYTHLATHLREAGFRVIGLGERKSDERLRKSFSCFRELALPTAPTGQVAAATSSVDLVAKVVELIRSEGGDDGFGIVKLSGRMHALHKTKISEQPEKTWRKFLENHGQHFDCDPKGPDAKVRLKGPTA